MISDLAGVGQISFSTAGEVSKRVEISPYPGGPSTKFEPGTDKTHSIYLLMFGTCGGGSGINATFAGVNVVGTR